ILSSVVSALPPRSRLAGASCPTARSCEYGFSHGPGSAAIFFLFFPPGNPAAPRERRKPRPRAFSFSFGAALKNASVQLYAWYKLATVGPCAAPRPGLLDFAGRAKWDAWKAQSAGSPSVEDSKRRYIATLEELTGWDPSAADEAAGKTEGPEPSMEEEEKEDEDEDEDEEEGRWSESEEDEAEYLRQKVLPSLSRDAPGGTSLIAVSTLCGGDCPGRDEEDDLPWVKRALKKTRRRPGSAEEERVLFRCAKSGDGTAEARAAIRQRPALARATDNLVSGFVSRKTFRARAPCRAARGIPSLRQGMTPLHWAADRGNFALVKELVETARADVNAR
ncbi:MAG: hypothetical protein BJ554DRAFT_6841, partial [Olpidium bornovanus]